MQSNHTSVIHTPIIYAPNPTNSNGGQEIFHISLTMSILAFLTLRNSFARCYMLAVSCSLPSVLIKMNQCLPTNGPSQHTRHSCPRSKPCMQHVSWRYPSPEGSEAVLPVLGHVATRFKGDADAAPASSTCNIITLISSRSTLDTNAVITLASHQRSTCRASVPCNSARTATSYTPSPWYSMVRSKLPCLAMNCRGSMALGREWATGKSSSSQAVKGTELSMPTTRRVSLTSTLEQSAGSAGTLPHTIIEVRVLMERTMGTCGRRRQRHKAPEGAVRLDKVSGSLYPESAPVSHSTQFVSAGKAGLY